MFQMDLSSRLAQWALKFQAYTFKSERRRGNLNMFEYSIESLTDFADDCGIFIDLLSPHFKSDEYHRLLDLVEKNFPQMPDLKIIYGYIYRQPM